MRLVSGAESGAFGDPIPKPQNVVRSPLHVREREASRREDIRVHVEECRVPTRPSATGARSPRGHMTGTHSRPTPDPEHVKGVLPEVPRCEARLYRGEWLALPWYAHPDGEAVRGLNRMWGEGDRLARVRNCFYTPDVLAEVCGELVPSRTRVST